MKLKPQERQRRLMQNRFIILEYCRRTGREPYEVGEIFKKNDCVLESLPGWADVMGDYKGGMITGTLATAPQPLAVSPSMDQVKEPETKEEPRDGEKIGEDPTDGIEVERVQGEVIPAGVMPDNIEFLIESAVDDFMQYKCKEPKKDSMTQCTEDTWAACCSFIGREVFKKHKLLHDKERERKEGGIIYDIERVSAGQDLYKQYCAMYNKMYSIMGCADFLGVSDDYIYGCTGGQRSNPSRRVFREKSLKDREESLRRGVVGGRKGSTLGYTVLLNHDNGYSTQKVEHVTTEKTETAAALPVFDDDVAALPGDVE